VKDNDEPAKASPPPGELPSSPVATPPVRLCPNCGGLLRERSCKLSCPTPGCGFFLSCADFV